MIKDDQTHLEPSTNALKSRTKQRFQWIYKLFSVFVILQFLSLLAVAFYQLDYWKSYFFHDSLNLGDKGFCVVQALSKAEESWPTDEEWMNVKAHSIEVPHPKFNPVEEYSGNKLKYRYLRYQCRHRLSEHGGLSSGLSMIHFGWIFAEHTLIRLNGVPVLEYKGNEKPVMSLSDDVLKEDVLNIELLLATSRDLRFGLAGGAPMVLSTGVNINSKVMGIEVALQLLRPLLRLMPALTLCLILIIAWKLGVTNRILLTAILYFGCVSGKNLFYYFVDFWPWNIATTYRIGMGLMVFVRLTFSLFCLEFFRIGGRYLERIKIFTLCFAVLYFAVNYYIAVVLQETALSVKINRIILEIVAYTTLILSSYGCFRSKNLSNQDRFLNFSLLGLVVALTVIQFVDTALANLGFGIVLKNQIELLAPFLVAAILFYQLSLIQRNYESEKSVRMRMQSDLELAREIQDSMSVPPPKSTIGSFNVSCYQVKHFEVAGDWMAIRHSGDGNVIAVVADVTGKGVQAALVVHAIQSMWADALSEDVFYPEQWIYKLNQTLFRLGEKKQHSATIGLAELSNHKVRYWSLGHTPCFYTFDNVKQVEKPKMRALHARGSILGLSKNIEFQESEVEFSPDQHMWLYLASDGVLEHGTRTKPREAVAVIQKVMAEGQSALNGFDQNDDKTLILIEKKSAS